MKKLICMIGHPKRIVRVSDCIEESFDNTRACIKVYTCKHCGEFVGAFTRYIKAQVKDISFDEAEY